MDARAREVPARVARVLRAVARLRTEHELTTVRRALHERLKQLHQQRAGRDRRELPAKGGRPRREMPREPILRLMRLGRSVREIARQLGLPRSTLGRYVATLPAHAWIYGPCISEDDGAILARSRVSVAVARAREYRSDSPGLRVPIWVLWATTPIWQQLRIRKPCSRRYRYRNPRDAYAVVDCSPAARAVVLDMARTLYVTESPRKADSATSHGLACVACAGVRLLPTEPGDWAGIPLRGREVRVALDSDAATNPEVGDAERRVVALLRDLGAHVRTVRLPGYHVGLDDWISERVAQYLAADAMIEPEVLGHRLADDLSAYEIDV